MRLKNEDSIMDRNPHLSSELLQMRSSLLQQFPRSVRDFKLPLRRLQHLGTVVANVADLLIDRPHIHSIGIVLLAMAIAWESRPYTPVRRPRLD
jgi:hypothetical protein